MSWPQLLPRVAASNKMTLFISASFGGYNNPRLLRQILHASLWFMDWAVATLLDAFCSGGFCVCDMACHENGIDSMVTCWPHLEQAQSLNTGVPTWLADPPWLHGESACYNDVKWVTHSPCASPMILPNGSRRPLAKPVFRKDELFVKNWRRPARQRVNRSCSWPGSSRGLPTFPLGRASLASESHRRHGLPRCIRQPEGSAPCLGTETRGTSHRTTINLRRRLSGNRFSSREQFGGVGVCHEGSCSACVCAH